MRFCEDHSGTVWIGSFDGLKKYDHQNDRFITFSPDPDDLHGYLSSRIHCITEDKYGTLWVSGWSESNQRDELCRVIDKEKGLFKRYYHDETDTKTLGDLLGPCQRQCFRFGGTTVSDRWSDAHILLMKRS